MKRGGPLRRVTPLKAAASLRRTAPRPRSKRPTPQGNPARWATWQALREVLYGRASGRCERCGRGLEDTGMEAHHRKLRSQGGRDDASTCVALCPGCHRWAHANPRQAQSDGWIVRERSIPAQVAVVLHDGRTVRFCDDGTYDVVWLADGTAA